MKKIVPFLFFLLFLPSVYMFAQSRANSSLSISHRLQECTQERDSLYAFFEANKTEGALPLSVLFTQTGTVEGVSYQWKFGDGGESTEKNPQHIYQKEGFFSVALWVTDANDSTFVAYRNRYITAGDPIKYDTLNFPIPGTFSLYTVNPPQSGYVSGNNSFKDVMKAEYFEKQAGFFTINDIWFDFAVAKRDTAYADTTVRFLMYSVDPETGAPLSNVHNFYLSMDSIIKDVSLDQASRLPLNAFDFKEDFFLAVLLPEYEGDTLALWSNTSGDVNPGDAWENWQDGTWVPLSSDQSWGLNINFGVYVSQFHGPLSVPEILDFPEMAIYPNPANDVLNIKLMEHSDRQLTYTLYNILGKKLSGVQSIEGSRDLVTMSLEQYPAGMYILNISDGINNIARKISITR